MGMMMDIIIIIIIMGIIMPIIPVMGSWVAGR